MTPLTASGERYGGVCHPEINICHLGSEAETRFPKSRNKEERKEALEVRVWVFFCNVHDRIASPSARAVPHLSHPGVNLIGWRVAPLPIYSLATQFRKISPVAAAAFWSANNDLETPPLHCIIGPGKCIRKQEALQPLEPPSTFFFAAPPVAKSPFFFGSETDTRRHSDVAIIRDQRG